LACVFVSGVLESPYAVAIAPLLTLKLSLPVGHIRRLGLGGHALSIH
jgi:hypothetical protein